VLFSRADREHERELAALAGTIRQLEGKVIALETAQAGEGKAAPSLSPEATPPAPASPAPR
jgi:hypothetical protein